MPAERHRPNYFDPSGEAPNWDGPDPVPGGPQLGATSLDHRLCDWCGQIKKREEFGSQEPGGEIGTDPICAQCREEEKYGDMAELLDQDFASAPKFRKMFRLGVLASFRGPRQLGSQYAAWIKKLAADKRSLGRAVSSMEAFIKFAAQGEKPAGKSAGTDPAFDIPDDPEKALLEAEEIMDRAHQRAAHRISQSPSSPDNGHAAN